MKSMYEKLQAKLMIDLQEARDEISHMGERGRSLERVLMDFLGERLPKRYSISTGIVVSSDGTHSGQTDVIIHDRDYAPLFLEKGGVTLVPIETVYGVISVKASLNRTELRNAFAQIASVRILKQNPKLSGHTLRPRAFVFAFDSTWKAPENAVAAAVAELDLIDDNLRPNAICALPLGLMVRKPTTLEIEIRNDNVLLRFFLFLTQTLDSFPLKRVDLVPYFEGYDDGTKQRE